MRGSVPPADHLYQPGSVQRIYALARRMAETTKALPFSGRTGYPEQMAELEYGAPGAVRLLMLERVSLRDDPRLGERWVQQQIAQHPALLGLGELVLRDKERTQPKAGRLDLLLQDPESLRRYEVEVQLGRTDEAHIIRTIEYWDIERKRYPQYEHCAVIVAEDITSRFLNVIQLFNGSIPLIALKMTAYRVGEGVALSFTTVLDEVSRGLVDEDEAVQLPTDRTDWEERASKTTLGMVDELLPLVREVAPRCELKYNKVYIGLAEDGQPNNFVAFQPRRERLLFLAKMEHNEDNDKLLADAGLDVMSPDPWNNYRMRLLPGDIMKYQPVLREVIRRAYEHSGK